MPLTLLTLSRGQLNLRAAGHSVLARWRISMASEWFYSQGGKSRLGPIATAQLQALAKSGQLKPTDLVWQQGMAQWVTASKIKGLFAPSVTKGVPPPIPQTSDPEKAKEVTSLPPKKGEALRHIPVWAWLVGVPVVSMFLCCGGCVMVGGLAELGHKVQQEQAAKAPVANVTWEEIDAIYNLKSRNTDLKKNEEWKKYKGKKVKWSGEVTSVSETFGTLQLQIKMNPDTFTSDLLIRLNADQKTKGLKLTKGDTVRFVGVLENWGSLLPITLSHGEIIDEVQEGAAKTGANEPGFKQGIEKEKPGGKKLEASRQL